MEVWYHHNGERRFKGVEQESFVAFPCTDTKNGVINVAGFDDRGNHFAKCDVIGVGPGFKEFGNRIPEHGIPFVSVFQARYEVESHCEQPSHECQENHQGAKSDPNAELAQVANDEASKGTRFILDEVAQEAREADSNEMPTTESGGGSCDSDSYEAEKSEVNDSELPAPTDSTPNP